MCVFMLAKINIICYIVFLKLHGLRLKLKHLELAKQTSRTGHRNRLDYNFYNFLFIFFVFPQTIFFTKRFLDPAPPEKLVLTTPPNKK